MEQGYLYGHVVSKTGRFHLVKADPWNDRALCGVAIFRQGLREEPYSDAKICPKCRAILNRMKNNAQSPSANGP